MKKLLIAIISLTVCALLLLIFFSQQGMIQKPAKMPQQDAAGNLPVITTAPEEPPADGTYYSDTSSETPSEPSASIPEVNEAPGTHEEADVQTETEAPTVAGTVPEPEISEPEVTEPEISEPVVELPDDAEPSDITEKPAEPENHEPTENPAEPEMHEPHEIIRTADQSGWRYAIRSFELLDELPQGISLSDTTQAFGSFDTYDESGLAVSRGDSVASHLSDSGKYDGYLGKEYVWAVLNFDLTNLTGKGEYIIVGDMHLSFGKYKKVRYMGKSQYRYEHFIEIGYMNMHDAMPDVPKNMQYYTLYFDADETKQLVFCYLIEKKYSDEEFYLEMNIHNDGENFGYISLSEAQDDQI